MQQSNLAAITGSTRAWATAIFLVAWALGQPAGWCQEASHDLFDRLQTSGIVIGNGTAIPLPSPSLSTGQTKVEQTEILDRLSGKLGWEKFSRKSVVAPVTIRVEYLKNAEGARIGHQVHSAFIAYAAMDTLRDQELMEATFGKSGGNADQEEAVFEKLPVEALESRGLGSIDPEREGYAKMQITLLNKIIVRGVVHLQKREGPHWFQLFWELDPRFTNDPLAAPSSPPPDKNGLSNTWTKLVPNEVGKRLPSAPVPYRGLGGYMTVYETGRATDQLLVESRLVLYEPQEWFAGSNLLRSKLPLSLQESARSFRRRLAK